MRKLKPIFDNLPEVIKLQSAGERIPMLQSLNNSLLFVLAVLGHYMKITQIVMLRHRT
jgi:hypothetical protein